MVRGTWEAQYHQPIPLPNWANAEESSLDIIMREPIRLSKAWVRSQVAALERQGVHLTYIALELDKDSGGEEDEPINIIDEVELAEKQKSDSEEYTSLAEKAKKVKKPPAKSPSKKDQPPSTKTRASKKRDMPSGPREFSKTKKVKVKEVTEEDAATQGDTILPTSPSPTAPSVSMATSTSIASTIVSPSIASTTVALTSPMTLAAIIQEISHTTTSLVSSISTTSCSLTISSNAPGSPISSIAATSCSSIATTPSPSTSSTQLSTSMALPPISTILSPSLSLPTLPLPSPLVISSTLAAVLANLTQTNLPTPPISSAIPISKMPTDSTFLAIPLLPIIDKVCAELGLQELEIELSLEVEKDAFVEVSNEISNEPLAEVVNIEVINISNSALEKGQIGEVFKVAQENKMIN